jgi:Rrf2 family protein
MLSSRAKYATRALLDLSLHYAQGPIQAQDIAERQAIPIKYLEQILLLLRVGGFIQSRKGPGGGYMLARLPEEITLGSVVRAMDGPLAPISCVSVSGYSECGCPDPDTCGLRLIWKEARDAIADVLDGTTFAMICEKHLHVHELPSPIIGALLEKESRG